MNATPPNSRTSFAEAPSLGAHVRECDRARSRGFFLQCLGERLHDVLGPRFFTTVFGATVLMTLLAGSA